MKQKITFTLFTMFICSACITGAERNIEAAEKFADMITRLAQIVGGGICLYAIFYTAIKQATRSLVGSSDRTAEEHKNLIARGKHLIVGLVMIFVLPTIINYLMGFH